MTVSEGEVDLQDFAGQLLAFVRQKGNKDFLVEHSGKCAARPSANANAGGWNGGPVPFAFDRAEFDGEGRFCGDSSGRIGRRPTPPIGSSSSHAKTRTS